ncbi:MAG: efflux RND transporter periplasmic adaptor subunit, partial [Planctomycetota bacterium]
MTLRLIMLGLVLGVTSVLGVQYATGPELANAESTSGDDISEAGRVLPVRTVIAERVSSFRRNREFTGKIVARRASDVGFKLPGKVVEVLVEEGQYVQKGDVIARLDARDTRAQLKQTDSQLQSAMATYLKLKNGPRKEVIDAARADVRRLEAALALQANNFERRNTLIKSSAVSTEEVEQFRYNKTATKAQLDAAQAKLSELIAGTREEDLESQRARLDQLAAAKKEIEIQLGDGEIAAPYSGTVSQRYVDEGIVLSAGSPIVRLVETEKLEAHVGVPSGMVHDLEMGAEHVVYCNGRSFSSKLRCVLPEVDPQTQTRKLIFDIVSSGSIPGAGEIARIELEARVRSDGFWLPATAVERGQRGLWSAYVVDTNDGVQRTSRRDVEVLFSDGDRVFVRGTLDSGEHVVCSGLHR